MSVSLVSAEIQNLRGFQKTRLSLDRDLTVLVGPNNSGKTSLLRLLDWVFNSATDDVLTGDRALRNDELNLLMPARKTRNAARRLTLGVQVADGRRHERFKCDDGVSLVRLGIKMPGGEARMRVNVGPPHRNEKTDSENALPLLNELRENVAFMLIPATRDARSTAFNRTFRSALRARLEERALHSGRAGAPAEYRAVRDALGGLNKLAEDLALPLWDAMNDAIPYGLVDHGRMTPQIGPRDLVGWIADRIALKVTTGQHDVDSVELTEVGSGLQSLLELAIHLSAEAETGVSQIVAVEEPEAFLHPSAQRALVRLMFESDSTKRLVSTHSSILVDEAPYESVVLTRDHRFFEPSDYDDERRAQIHTALLAGHGSEMAFARSVLLVEGEGDRLFFERIRRRLARRSKSGRIDEMFVIPVGSKSQFAPWIRLLQSYGEDGNRPITWLVVADGDAPTELIRAFRDASVTVPNPVVQLCQTLSDANAHGNTEARRRAAIRVNQRTNQLGLPFAFVPVDLEWSALSNASAETVQGIIERAALDVGNRDELLNKIGSKFDTPVSRPIKAPYVRGLIADELPWSEVSGPVKSILRRWMRGAVLQSEIAQIMNDESI